MMRYDLYQINADRMADAAFLPFDPNRPPRRADYHLAYQGEVGGAVGHDDAANTTFVQTALALLFRQFNIDHPADFEGYSMSVGDVIVLDQVSLYYCDTIGWRLIEGGWQ